MQNKFGFIICLKTLNFKSYFLRWKLHLELNQKTNAKQTQLEKFINYQNYKNQRLKVNLEILKIILFSVVFFISTCRRRFTPWFIFNTANWRRGPLCSLFLFLYFASLIVLDTLYGILGTLLNFYFQFVEQKCNYFFFQSWV